MSFNWRALVTAIASAVVPIAFPAAAPAVPFIIHAINTSEDMGGTGPDKLANAIKIVNDGVQATNQIAGKTVIDNNALNLVLSNAISAIVNASNVVPKSK